LLLHIIKLCQHNQNDVLDGFYKVTLHLIKLSPEEYAENLISIMNIDNIMKLGCKKSKNFKYYKFVIVIIEWMHICVQALCAVALWTTLLLFIQLQL